MNQRIQELAKQANDYATKTVDYHRCEDFEYKNELYKVSMEKFAELIVRECGVVAYKTYCQTPGALGIQYKQAIEEHFGVE
jgi:hypothetical protein